MIPESVLSPSESASVSGHVPVGPDLGATHHVASGGIDHHGIHMTDDRPSPYTTRDDFAAACDDLSIRHTRTKPRDGPWSPQEHQFPVPLKSPQSPKFLIVMCLIHPSQMTPKKGKVRLIQAFTMDLPT